MLDRCVDALDGGVAAVVEGVTVEQILAFEVATRFERTCGDLLHLRGLEDQRLVNFVD